MAKFDLFLNKLLRIEGGYSNHKNDRGGCTNKGVTLSTYKAFFGSGLNCDDLKKITDKEVTKIYKEGYWDPCYGDKIACSQVAYLLVDWAVNSGVKTAVKGIQELVGARVDGIMGTQTINCINSYYDPKELFEMLKDARVKYYHDFVKRNPSQKTFLTGWMNRLDNYKWEE